MRRWASGTAAMMRGMAIYMVGLLLFVTLIEIARRPARNVAAGVFKQASF